MRRDRCISYSTLTKLVALLMLSVMVTLLVGRTAHICTHSTISCKHSSDDESGHNHKDCKICHFELSFFDRVDEMYIQHISSTPSIVVVGYTQKSHSVNILTQTTRAPPESII